MADQTVYPVFPMGVDCGAHNCSPEFRWFWELQQHCAYKHGPARLDFHDYERDDTVEWVSSIPTTNELSTDKRVGPAQRFNESGSGDNTGFVTKTPIAHGQPSEITTMFYVHLHETSDHTNEHDLHSEWQSTKRALLFRYDPGTNTMEAFIYTDTQYGGGYASASDINDGKWHLVTLRASNGNLKVFVDDAKISTLYTYTQGTIGEGTASVGTRVIASYSANDGGQYDIKWCASFRVGLSDEQIIQVARNPSAPFEPYDEAGVVYGLPAGSPITVPVGLASETDTAFPVARAKSRAVGLITETATAFPITVVKTRGIGLASETDTAFPVTALTGVPVGLATGTDTAFPVGRAKSRAAGLASETDTALPVQIIKLRGVGLAIETDSALGITSVKAVSVGLATGADTAFPVARAKSRPVGLATGIDTALPVTALSGFIVGRATEIGTAFPVARAKGRALGIALGTETAFAITVARSATANILKAPAYAGILTADGGGNIIEVPPDGGTLKA